jgi:hypothetical protein
MAQRTVAALAVWSTFIATIGTGVSIVAVPRLVPFFIQTSLLALSVLLYAIVSRLSQDRN